MSLLDAPADTRGRVDVLPRRSDRRSLWLLFLLFVLVAATLRVPAFSNRVFNSDEAYLATQAQALNHGERLYVDTVDRKPPLVPYLYATVFAVTGSDDLAPVRVVGTLALAITALLLAAEARRRLGWRHAGMIAGLLFLLAATAFRPLDAQAANFEVFMLPITTGAMLFGIRRKTAASGGTLALATLTLQTAAVVLLPLAWLAWRSRRWAGLAILAVTFTVPVLVAGLIFGWHDFFRWLFFSNGAYLDVHGALGYALRTGLSQTGWFLLGSAALVLLVPFAWRHRREDVELWLWLAVSLVAVTAGLRFFGHYYLQLLPPLTLLGVRGLGSRPLLARRSAIVAVGMVAIVPAALFLTVAFTSHNSKDTQIALAVGKYVAVHTQPGQRVLVWGQAPEAYWSSDRRPAVRFATTAFVTGTSGGRPPSRVGLQFAVPGAWDDFIADLRAHPPVLIANMSTADQRHASFSPPSKYPRFARYLARGGWHPVATVDGVRILRRRTK